MTTETTGKLLSLNHYRKKYDETTVYVGDTIEWQNFDGTLKLAVVFKIMYFQPYPMRIIPEERHSMPMLDRNSYALDLGHGLSVVGGSVTRKDVRKAPRRNVPKNKRQKMAKVGGKL